MEGRRRSRDRRLKRCHQCNRLEDQLWATAYEQIWPMVRRIVRRRPAEERQLVGGVATVGGRITRRA